MLNQSFTAENFRKILDFQNRKGIYLEKDFFPKVEEITIKIKSCKHDIRCLRKEKNKQSSEVYSEKIDKLYELYASLKQEKEQAIEFELQGINESLNKSDFNFPLKKVSTPTGKDAYCFSHEPLSYFVSKQVQYNIGKLYGVKQSNRDEILSQLLTILSDNYPKIVIRTDIKSFYESIPQDKLRKKINSDPLLSLSSKRVIDQILKDYIKLSGSNIGIPRGIGISAYLAELYLKELDYAIRDRSDLVYYARYVDDIVAIFTPDLSVDDSYYKNILSKEVESLGLKLAGDEKTKVVNLSEPMNATMEYLGYRISFGTGAVDISMSRKKFQRYKQRIKSTFESYIKECKTGEKNSRKSLVRRVRFLTGNARLVNNKKNAVVGIYFSNKYLTTTNDLDSLDLFMKQQIDIIGNESVKRRLRKYSFRAGFDFKRFSKYSEKQLYTIVGAWKNA